MTHVYVLQHVHESQNEEEDTKFIGVYSTGEDAKAAVGRLKILPGFCEHQEGFQITRYELDKDHWTEGFISWREAVENGERATDGDDRK